MLKPLKILTLFTVLSLSCLLIGAKANPKMPLGNPSIQWADDPNQAAQPEMNGVELSVLVPRQGIVGEPLRIKISLVNRSQHPIFYELVFLHPDYRSAIPDFHLAIRDTEGQTIPLTKYGHLRFPPVYAVQEPFITDQVSVGTARSFWLNLPRCYDLSVAGKCSVSVTIDINPAGFAGFSLKSLPVSFVIMNSVTKKAH